MCVPNLHTTPKRHLIKIRTFLKKIDSYLEKYKVARRLILKGLGSTKFLEILHSNKSLTNVRTTDLQLLLSRANFVREPFQICLKIRTPLDSKHLNFIIFSSILHHKYPNNYVNQKLHTSSRFATFRAISNLFSFFYTPCILDGMA